MAWVIMLSFWYRREQSRELKNGRNIRRWTSRGHPHRRGMERASPEGKWFQEIGNSPSSLSFISAFDYSDSFLNMDLRFLCVRFWSPVFHVVWFSESCISFFIFHFFFQFFNPYDATYSGLSGFKVERQKDLWTLNNHDYHGILVDLLKLEPWIFLVPIEFSRLFIFAFIWVDGGSQGDTF